MIRFPKKRADGSFDVVVRIAGVANERVDLERWLSDWAEQNASWERIWEGGGKRTVERLRFEEDFFAPPSRESCDGAEIAIRLRCRPEAKMWKDWTAKLVEEFCAAHPGASLIRVESA